MERGYYLPTALNSNTDIRTADVYYRGNEYCFDVIPGEKRIIELVQQDLKANRQVVWMTPFVKQRHFNKVMHLLDVLVEQPNMNEISVNDIGVLASARSRWPSKSFTIGCLLAPFFINLPTDKLSELGVKRIESDDLEILVGSSPCVPISFHLPYRYITISDRCPFCENERSTCRKECTSSIHKVQESKGQGNLFMVGRTLLEMVRIPEINWSVYNIDRIVWHPTLLF